MAYARRSTRRRTTRAKAPSRTYSRARRRTAAPRARSRRSVARPRRASAGNRTIRLEIVQAPQSTVTPLAGPIMAAPAPVDKPLKKAKY